MSATWNGDDITGWKAPDPVPITPAGWLRAIIRGGILVWLLLGGLVFLLAIRLAERPLFGAARPITPFITQLVCRASILVLGIRFRRKGKVMRGAGAVVANHCSWLDILMLNAGACVYFVAKSEVEKWPGIGWLARATGTLFIRRDRRDALVQVAMFRHRLVAGHRLLFFPEGTSTDSRRVLPFKTSLFAAFLTPELRDDMRIQPVTLQYVAPIGQDIRFYGWWGEMGLAPHLLKVLSARRQGQVTLHYHAPVFAKEYKDRKALAAICETQVRAGLGV